MSSVRRHLATPVPTPAASAAARRATLLASVVLDNLSTHTAAALYQTFPPAEARRLAAKLEFHYTPKHASWLNMAELELAALTRQCLGRRLATQADVAREVAAWQARRNHAAAGVTWRFTTADARTKLARLYPEIA